MYIWRKLTPQQKEELRTRRRQLNRPPHSIPHINSCRTSRYMVTAACYEHRPIIGLSPERMLQFESDLLQVLNVLCSTIFAWIVLPNHYHVLIEIPEIDKLLKKIGQLHGRTSFDWNGEENHRGRKVWCNAAETALKSEAHFFASMNYVLNNAVHHGYVTKWDDWPYTNTREYLKSVGRSEAIRIWKSYPIKEYGQNWDPPKM